MLAQIKVKQIATGNELSGKTIKTNGSGKFIFDYPISKGSSFPLNPVSGDTYYRTDVDVLFYYDSSRLKWLSVNSSIMSCGRSLLSAGSTGYMYVGNAVQSSASGFKMSYNGTIISASVQNSTLATGNRTMDIRVNNSTVNRIQLTVTSGNRGTSMNSGNLDFVSGDLIQCVLLSGTDGYDNIIVNFEIARRI